MTNVGKRLRRLQPVRVEFHPAERVALLSARGHTDPGHLAGLTDSRLLDWFVSYQEGTEDLCEIWVLSGTGGNTRRRIKRPQS